MFKFVILLACIATVAIVNAAPATTERETEQKVVKILSSEQNKNDDGSYNVAYELDDGTQRKEEAAVTNAGTEEQSLEVKGSYKYIDDEGQEVEVFYTAGVNGFVPYGKTINADISAVAEAAKDLPKEENYVKTSKKVKTSTKNLPTEEN